MQKNFPPSSAPPQPQAANAPQQSNWPFMVIAILMALVLWLFVRTGAQPLGQRVVYVPIAVTNGSPVLSVSPLKIEVRLEAASNVLERLSPDEVAVIADLAGHRAGDLVPLTVIPPQGVKLLGTTVSQVRVVEKQPSTP
jgi:hypothetical protein